MIAAATIVHDFESFNVQSFMRLLVARHFGRTPDLVPRQVHRLRVQPRGLSFAIVIDLLLKSSLALQRLSRRTLLPQLSAAASERRNGLIWSFHHRKTKPDIVSPTRARCHSARTE